MKKRLVIANWKMYVEDKEAATTFARALRARMRTFANVEVSIAPSFVLLPAVSEALSRSNIAAGAQYLSSFAKGAHTGEISGKMLQDAGATFTIVGHSERRGLGETNEMVRAQVLEASDAGLGVVLCVGERERDTGGEHFSYIKEQLSSALTNLPKKAVSKLILAYEPVWAIGKLAQDAMKPQEIQEAAIFIRKTITGVLPPDAAKKVPILYGGSVEESNAGAILKDGGVNGFLVGHASAHLENFLGILKACKE
jgi:triosephosphate isomerase